MEKFKKITEENVDNFMEEPIYEDWLVDKVKANLIGNIADEQILYEQSLINCESPIEQLLALELQNLKLDNILLYNPFIDILTIEKQKEIKIGKNKYRVDFFIPVIYKNQGLKEFIIECDGYDFHQKTKEQIEKDNIRQRNLQKNGYIVIRFSGTEIWHKPSKCAQEILNIILSYCEYKNE